MNDEIRDAYERRYREVLVHIAPNLQSLIAGYFHEVPRVDQVRARAKHPERFLRKALQKSEDGKPKYDDPLGQVQDQLGARVVVLYKDDVESTCERILRFFASIESAIKEPDSEWEFGYFGLHMILALPGDVVPPGIALANAPRFFELQVKTLFQHSWSESNHEIGYKSVADLPKDQKRLLALASAQAWSADQIFSELIGAPRKPS